QVTGDRHRNVLVADARDFHGQDQVVRRLGHIDGRHPRPTRGHRPNRRSTDKRLEQAVHLTLHVGKVPKWLPSIREPERTPTLHRHSALLGYLGRPPAGPEYTVRISSELYAVKYDPGPCAYRDLRGGVVP